MYKARRFPRRNHWSIGGRKMANWSWMKKQHSDLIGSFLLSFGGSMMIMHALGLSHRLLLLSVTTVLIQAILFAIDCYKKQPVVYVLIGGIGIGLFWLGYHQESLGNLFVEAFKWLQGWDGTQKNNEKIYEMICILVLAIAVGSMSYIGNKFKIVKIGFVAGTIISLIVMGIMEIKTSKIGIMCVVAYGLMFVIESRHIGAYGKEQNETWKVTTGLVPVCMLLGIGSILLPSKEEPLSWQWASNGYRLVMNCIEDVEAEIAFRFGGASDEFGLTFNGVEKENALGGNIGTGNDIMLKVEPVVKTHHPIYLAGSYMDTYTGKSWTCTYNEETVGLEEYKLNTYELLLGLAQGEVEQDGEVLVKENELNISYEQIRTRTLFAPAMMMSIEGITGKRIPTYTSASITFPKRQKKAQYYTATFLEVNAESDLFKERIKEMNSFSYANNPMLNKEQLLERFQEKVDKSFLKEEIKVEDLVWQLSERSQNIREVYTTLPADLPERIYTLTKEITKGCETQYEQLKAIEQYLKSYAYTKRPGEIPEQEDFVDYFLFERKEGYCTYFATSMAVMARTLDIPTRYVEGFVVDYSDKEQGKIFNVRAEKAHAWVEAYFEGIGWLRFEPSAGYENTTYTSWKPYTSENDQVGQQIDETEEMEIQGEALILDTLENKVEKNEKTSRNYGLIAIQLIGVIIAFTIVMGGLQIGVYTRKFYKADALTQYKMRFKEIMYLFGRMGYQIKPEETLLQFQRSIASEEERALIKRIIQMYSKVRYRHRAKVSKEQQEELEGMYQTFCRTQSNREGKFKLSWWRLTYRMYGYKKM